MIRLNRRRTVTRHSYVPQPLEGRFLLSTYYVATTGDDAHPGTALDQPLRTIQEAAERARSGDTVLVRGGTYREAIRPARSGTADDPITFRPYNGEAVTVSGADPVTGWSRLSGSVYKASRNADLGVGNNQLFVDGRMMIEARWPNTTLDVSRPRKATADTVNAVFAGQASYATLTDSGLAAANFADGAWDGGVLHIASGQGWVTQTAAVTDSTAGGSLSFDYVQRTNNFKSDRFETPEAGDAYFLTGKFVGLDAAGEWFYEDSSDTLYLWTPGGDSPSGHTVEAKARKSAFDLSGRSYVDVEGFRVFAATIVTDAASNGIRLDGIDAEYVSHFSTSPTGWEVPSDAGIYLAGSNSSLRNSTISFSAGHGVNVIGSFNRVENNVIHDVAYSGANGSGIRVAGPGHVLRSNTIYNAGRTGILHTRLTGGRIIHNTIHDVMLQTTDGGGTYAFGADGAGTEIAYNRVYNVLTGGFGGAGVYLDNGSSNHVVHHNLVYNANHAVKLNPPSPTNQVFNNTLLGTSRSVATSGDKSMPGTAFRNNIFNKPVDIGPGAVQESNVYASAAAQFVDPANGDYRLQPTSPGVDDGMLLSPYTDGYAGGAPDAGAFETGRAAWTSGASGAISVPDDDPPATPRALTATASAAGITLNWHHAPDPDRAGYHVYRAAASTGPYTRVTSRPLAASHYLDPGAALEATTHYRVVAIDTSDNLSAPASTSAFADTPGAAPPAPSNLVLTPSSATAIDLAWNLVPDVSGYRVERKAPGESSFREIANVNVPTFRDGNLVAGGAYGYRVRAENLRGVSSPSSTVSASPLATPAGLTATVAGAMRTDLAWSNVTGEARYDVQRGRDGQTGWLTIAATMPDVTRYSDVSVATGGRYFYRVVAVGNAGPSAPSDVAGTGAEVSAYRSVDISAVPAGSTTVVGADTAFDVTGGGGDINGAADRFRFVYREVTGDFDVRVRLQSLTHTHEWTKAGLMARQDLSSDSRNVFMLATPGENGFRISSRFSDGGTTLVTGAGGAVSYPNTWLRLRRTGATFTGYRSSDGVNWFFVGSRTLSLPERVYFGMALTSHDTRATATAKFRDLSDVPDRGPVVPAAPARLSTTAASPSRVDLDWSASAGATGYRLERKGPGDTAFEELARVSATSYRDASVNGGATYAYRVRAENSAGVSAPGAAVSVETPAPVGALVGVDVGGSMPAGSTAVVREGTDYDLIAGGTDVNGATDRFHFAHRQVTGDFDVKVRLQSLGASNEWAKAGIMAREDLTGGSRNVFALATPGTNGYRISSRSTAGGSTFVNGSGVVSYPNTWLRLKRDGDNFTAYRGSDGQTWTQTGTTRTLALPETLYLGLAATSHTTQTTTRAEFRNFGDA